MPTIVALLRLVKWVFIGIPSSVFRLIRLGFAGSISILRGSKAIPLHLRTMLSRDSINAILLLCAIASLIFVGIQTRSLSKQTSLLTEQTSILQADYETRSRPYIAVEDVQIEYIQVDERRVLPQVVLDVKNWGVMPAEDIRLARIELHQLLEPTPTPELTCSTLDNGITICVGGIAEPHLTASMTGMYDRILYPGRMLRVKLPIEGSAAVYFQDILENGKLKIVLSYSGGGNSYSYSAEIRQIDGTWQITSER